MSNDSPRTDDDPLDDRPADTPQEEESATPSSGDEPRGSDAAETVADAVSWTGNALAGFTGNMAFFATSVVNKIPKVNAAVIWRKLALASFHNWHKQAGGHAIALNGLPNNHVDAEPVKYLDSATADGKPGWKSKGRDKIWKTGADGRDVDYLGGRTPVIWTDDDAPEIGGRFQSRVGECIDLGQHAPLYHNPEFNVTLDAGPELEGGAGQARADGGMQIELTSEGVFGEESIVNLGSGEGYDGMQISWRKYTETYPETTSSEEMRKQEERGRIAEMDPEGEKEFVKKMALYFILGILGVLAIIFVLPAILSGSGGGGGGGGGVMPIMLDTAGMML